MTTNKAKTEDSFSATVISGKHSDAAIRAGGMFTVQCHDSEGNLKWEDKKHNLVVNAGLKFMNDTFFIGSGYGAAWYIGLYGAAASNNPAATDTMSSHIGWTEVTAYTLGTRPVATFAAATNADPSVATTAASPAVFTMNATTTVGGAFLTTGSAKGGTAGTLFSAADFSAPGDRSVISGDTLTITYTFSLDAA